MTAADSGEDRFRKGSLRHHLEETNTFVNMVELVNSRGVITERGGSRVLELARDLSDHPDIHGLSITDNPGGNAVLASDTLGTDLLNRGQDVVIHLSCKDWNRNAIQSKSWQLASEGFDNVLTLSGDYPIAGYEGTASGVFDIDSVGLLKLLCDMNAGLETRTPKGRVSKMECTRFFLGTVVNNFKRFEREVMPQYFKLKKKIETGAHFAINQIGYNSRKQDELLKYMQLKGLDVPVIANVYILSAPAARYFHGGNIPGVVVPDELFALTEKHGGDKDKGKAFFLEFAAKQCAVAKGLGFRGAYLGGHLKYEDFARVLELAANYAEDDWKLFASEFNYDLQDEFYFFEPDPATGLSSTEINRQYLESKSSGGRRAQRRRIPSSYKINRRVHDRVFEPGHVGHRVGKKLFELVEQSGKGVKKAVHTLEQVAKVPLFDCRDCGDCSLPDIAYLCPESQCVKNERNGPCGGTRQGKCEVGEKDCIWSLAYDRLKAYGEEEEMLDRPVVYRNGSLKGTSAWSNTYLGLDHHGKQTPGEETASTAHDSTSVASSAEQKAKENK
jgi:methylenetetrahydrofolate reductase (NADPH)